MTDKKNPTLNDVCTLIALEYTADDVGNQMETEQQTEVFCGEVAVTEREFYEAAQAGIRPECAIIVNSLDYDGQEWIAFHGKEYQLLRRYPRLDEFTELYLQRK